MNVKNGMRSPDSVWCGLQEILVPTPTGVLFKTEAGTVLALKNIMKIETRDSYTAFQRLMSKTDRGIDLEFVSRFPDFFKIDVECICRDLLDESTKSDMAFSLGKKVAAGKVGEAFLLKYHNKFLILKSIRGLMPRGYLSLKIKTLSSSPTLLRIMNPGLTVNSWIKKQTSSPKLLAVGGDNFTNQTCIHMALNLILKDSPNYIYQYDAFYCHDGGYNVTNLANQGDLSSYLDTLTEADITEDFLVDLFTQVLTPLTTLKSNKYAFVHADLKARNVFVNLNPDGTRTYLLADFDKSSIFWRGLRFYNQSGDYRLSDLPFTPMEGPEGLYYVIDNFEVRSGLPIQVYTMHNPYGFYLSYDLYTFWYSVMMEPVVWRYIQHSTDSGTVVSTWKSMWHADEYSTVMQGIRDTHETLESLGDPEAKQLMLAEMRSIRTIANKFYSEAYKLRVDLSGMYSKFGLGVRDLPESSVSSRTIEMSDDGHVCIKPCRKSTGFRGGYKCDTNTYSKAGVVYKWDWCGGS